MWHTPFSIYEMPAGVGHWGGHFFSLFLHVSEESDRIYNQRKNCDYKHRDIVTCHVPRAS